MDPNWTRAFVASFFKLAYFFGAFNQKLAKSESSNWIFWFSSACNSATSNVSALQSSFLWPNGLRRSKIKLTPSHHKPQHQLQMETEHVDTTPLLVQGSVLWNLLANLSSIERGLALHLEITSHYPLLQEIPCNAETNQNHQFLLAWRK